MATIIKELKGHSGSKVKLLHGPNGFYVQKIDNVLRNKERLDALAGIVPLPKILKYDSNCLEMQYIHGQDMITFLQYNKSERLLYFLEESILTFQNHKQVDKDYTFVYNEQLYWIDSIKDLPFNQKELIRTLPRILPQSKYYHGDMTLENIIHRQDGKFFFIDPVTVPYDSWVFDIAKLRQDTHCQWFLRNSNIRLNAKLKLLDDSICKKFPSGSSDSLLILMLLRVLRHCKHGDSDYQFLLTHINRLWTNICK